jgi:hypothetical protein
MGKTASIDLERTGKKSSPVLNIICSTWLQVELLDDSWIYAPGVEKESGL